MDGYAGQTMCVRFRAVQGSAWYEDHWHIDDVRIEAAEGSTAAPTPITAATVSRLLLPDPALVLMAPLAVVLAAPSYDPVYDPVPAPPTRPTSDTTTRTINYTYDPLYRLTDAHYSSGPHYEYQYDAVGNRVAMITPVGTASYIYDAAGVTIVRGKARFYACCGLRE